MSDSKLKLVRQWKRGNVDYRLLSRESYNYRTEFVMEMDAKDSLGAPKWVEIHSWTDKETDAKSHALTALAGLLKEPSTP